jgi:hypothetical protein
MRAVAFALLLIACGPGVKGGPTMNSKMNHDALTPTETSTGEDSPVVSHDIMARETLTNHAMVKHILVGWKDLGEAYNGHQDARGAKRTKAEAESVIQEALAKLKNGDDFDAVMKEYSEDSVSTSTGKPLEVKPDAGLVIEFRLLSMRLNVGEIGVCQSDFGFHIIKRLE